jgi:hypothetical protein
VQCNLLDHVPLADSSKPPPSPASKQFMRMFESKRNFVGSIYEQSVTQADPGVGRYNTLTAFEKTSKIVSIQVICHAGGFRVDLY